MKKIIYLMLMGTCLMGGISYAQEMIDSQQSQEDANIQMDKEAFMAHRKQMREKFAERLNLTEDQKTKAQEIQTKTDEKMKPIHEKMKALHQEAQTVRDESKKEFEALLNDDQKQTLKTMDEERKTKMKERKKEFRHRSHDRKPKPFMGKRMSAEEINK